jgi:hypothetical protein
VNLRRRKHPIQISEAELASMTADLDALHHDVALPAMSEHVSEWAELNHAARGGLERLTATTTSRRGFLFGTGGAALGAVILAACSKSSNKSSSGSSSTTAAGGQLTGDVQIAAMAASLENLAVGTYQAGLQAAQAGKLGSVPPAVATFATTAMSQHKDHAAAWNAIVTSAGHAEITQADPIVKPTIDSAFAAVKDVPGLAKLALQLENVAAATYLNGIGVITDKKALATAASIQPVEMQHAAILNFVLGQYPVPDAFAKTDGARPPSDISK